MRRLPKSLPSKNLQAVADLRELFFRTCSKNYKRKSNKMKNFTRRILRRAKSPKTRQNLASLWVEFFKSNLLRSGLIRVDNLKLTSISFPWILNFWSAMIMKGPLSRYKGKEALKGTPRKEHWFINKWVITIFLTLRIAVEASTRWYPVTRTSSRKWRSSWVIHKFRRRYVFTRTYKTPTKI